MIINSTLEKGQSSFESDPEATLTNFEDADYLAKLTETIKELWKSIPKAKEDGEAIMKRLAVKKEELTKELIWE